FNFKGRGDKSNSKNINASDEINAMNSGRSWALARRPSGTCRRTSGKVNGLRFIIKQWLK
ncbi:MAG: hypothetical protein WBZ29_07855, partial [Methanocella sp.]